MKFLFLMQNQVLVVFSNIWNTPHIISFRHIGVFFLSDSVTFSTKTQYFVSG